MGMMTLPAALTDIMKAPFASGQAAEVEPGANGNAVIAHGMGRTPTWANAQIIGDLGGVNVHVEIQALDATNITLRFSESDGTDVTSGGPYTVAWLAK